MQKFSVVVIVLCGCRPINKFCRKILKGKIKPVHIVDVPGHSRLRPKLDEYLPQAAGIVFVVDALDFLPNCGASSEYLYDLLTKAICTSFQETHKPSICLISDIWKQMSMCQHYYM
ncbi:signal recognition particle receptor subunit beta [Trifolium repens]|nr:signal recognition particle receptor subunit beta [Trifolium repens]